MKTLLIIFLLTSSICLSQVPDFNSSINYKSVLSSSKYGEQKFKIPSSTFKFENDLMITSRNDQFKRIRYYKLDESGDDNTTIWKIYKCKDNSGSDLTVMMLYDKDSKTKSIFLINPVFEMYYDVVEYTQPSTSQVTDIYNGIVGDGRIGTEYTRQDVDNFVMDLKSARDQLKQSVFEGKDPKIFWENLKLDLIDVGKQAQKFYKDFTKDF